MWPGRPGSSTGPAVAVAAGLTPLDIAADTGGSIPVRKFRVLTTAGPVARSIAELRWRRS
jgi:hypothetical protein